MMICDVFHHALFHPDCRVSLTAVMSFSSSSSNINAAYNIPSNLGAGGWSPLDTDRYQWLQVDLGSRKEIVGIATQGRYSSSDWTRKYQLIYSDTPKNWRPYLHDGNIWVSKTLQSRLLMSFKLSYYPLKSGLLCCSKCWEITPILLFNLLNHAVFNLKMCALKHFLLHMFW